MKDIIVTFYNRKTNKIQSVEVRNYGIPQAIEEVRVLYSYSILTLKAEYKDIDSVVAELKKLKVG